MIAVHRFRRLLFGTNRRCSHWIGNRHIPYYFNYQPNSRQLCKDAFRVEEKEEIQNFFRFEIVHQSSKSRARVGRIYTPHGIVDTPAYVAVATNAALKHVDHRLVSEAGQQLMFCNTYHLLLHPGPCVIEAAGGLHKFMNRKGAIITDSGGFQVFSLSHGSVYDELNMKSRSGGNKNFTSLLLSVTEEGATFRSYRDGSKVTLTPEYSVQIQKSLKGDIIIPLDELPPYHMERSQLEESVNLTHRWELRSLQEHRRNVQNQAMYAVIHGGIDTELRQKSIDFLCSLPFDGFAIGGSLGKNRQELFQLLEFVMPRLPTAFPNHLLGIADLESIERVVPLGVDTMDSCYPFRVGRHGNLFTRRGVLHISQSKYKNMFEPPDPEWGLKDVTLAYLHHLLKAREPMALTLLSLHNAIFMVEYMNDIRKRILQDEI
ncbi:Queuine tRNA-ribosyltransferase [Galdieria sulphuraria]|uniref:Queuine tRNA-ribosyltransferase n=1 Tax=Galdieria sulphuraria TaxID=130081 RepID=M2X8T0_GALSU|nr:queuine tRNA-ribosyltransferase [Galdieria sulphuraria]EME26237.1 queuine tRNA-ribosyltransferase [Galdieria sulphuraria]GJD07946.1 Queuine tRNA-ribosyltransferase [Galdieria sulphuraria]|eukprot:XP_005702757.1 queuine tRNA-ribosyltransferase [Galdieria sulphuraria]